MSEHEKTTISSAELTANYRCAFPEISGDTVSSLLSSEQGKKLAEDFIARYNYPLVQEAKIYTEKLFLEKFLSEGRFITGHHVASIKERHTDNVVGTLWYTENFINRNQETVARICYLEIQEAMRHQGYGAAALHHVIQQLLAVKIKKLTLNVFADNHFAIHLYEKNGFSIV